MDGVMPGWQPGQQINGNGANIRIGQSQQQQQQQQQQQSSQKPPSRRRRKGAGSVDDSTKRRCVSTACIACRRRKSKCDGNLPACSSCASVYNTECVYDPSSDHRRKGVYKKDIDKLKTRNSTLEVLIQAILNYPENEVAELIKSIRTCESLDAVAEGILTKEADMEEEDEELDGESIQDLEAQPAFEKQLSGRMGELRLEEGVMRYIGGTSHLIFSGAQAGEDGLGQNAVDGSEYQQQEDPVTSWTTVTTDSELVLHLLNMYFAWHWAYFTCVPKSLFYRDFLLGNPPSGHGRKYCTPLLVNAMLALGCHFTARSGARLDADDSATAGDHFFKEAKRLILEHDEHERPAMPTVQALALMSVREAGCGREAKGWVYSGMSFRMACDLGLNLDSGGLAAAGGARKDDLEEDARRITFWGCFLFDKCWSNYLGRMPQLPRSIVTVPKIEVFPTEDAETWAAYTDSGFNQSHAQPSRTRAVARQISALCEISGDLMEYFYNPTDMDKAKGKQTELKKLSEIHQRLEGWRRELPKEFEPKEGCLPSMLVAHMFFQLLYIHLFRPFLKYSPQHSPLPSNVSPRKLCTTAAAMISKLLRLYKRSHGLRQICNIAVYITQNACTIHLLNLPSKDAKRDITHGIKHLEEIAESWLCARRTLSILSVLSKRWNVAMPEEADQVLQRCEEKFGPFTPDYHTSPRTTNTSLAQQQRQSLSPPEISPSEVMANDSSFVPAAGTRGQDSFAMPGTGTGVVSPTSLQPPTTAHEFYIYPRSTRQAAQTPATTSTTPVHSRLDSRHSIDSVTQSPVSKASPSDLFGGVDQLLRTSAAADNGQDWWMRDQSQLAVGFDNWSESAAEWFASGGGGAADPAAMPAGNQPPGFSPTKAPGVRDSMDVGGLSITDGLGAAMGANPSSGAVGVPNGGPVMSANPHLSGLGVNGFHGVLGYDESQWYL